MAAYRFTRTVAFKTIAAMMESMPTCIKIVDYISKTWKVEAHLMAPTLGGHPARVVFVTMVDDINALQASQAESMKDKKYLTLINALHPHIDGSATNDQVYKIIV